MSVPKISVVILNYNSRQWLPRCFESLESQTIFKEIEIIVPDNASTDGSDKLADDWLKKKGKGRMVQTGSNLGYSGGNNQGAAVASGKYLFFLNNDTWLEPDCLEVLFREVEAAGADAASPVVLNYNDSSFQTIGGPGLDLFGIPVPMPTRSPPSHTSKLFSIPGCSLLIRAELFRKIGEFDAAHFLYGEEADLSWRVWIAGGEIVGVPSARLHHQGGGTTNSPGTTSSKQFRTTSDRRYFTNRNGLIRLMKNAQHILLLLVVPQLMLLFAELLAVLLMVRDWRFVHRAYIEAVWDAFKMLPHVQKRRRQIRTFRKRGDFWMLRFLRLKPSRWSEVEPLFDSGWPFKSNVLKVERK